jgi:Flp pilus assembly protein TadB
MAHTDARALRAEIASQRAETASQSFARAERESDDDFDFPPTAHPGRELFTASLFVLLIIAFVVWGGWKLISLI